MTAAWTTPKTWNTGDPLTASDMNTHIRDNFEFVKTPPTGYYKANEASDYTTTSSSFANVDATNFVQTITTAGGDVLVGFSGTIKHSTAGQNVYLDVEVDGVRAAGDDGMLQVSCPGTNYAFNATFVRMIRGLSAGSHTFKLQWKTSAATATMFAGAGTSGSDLHPEFWVREVS
jgi:hypothetical protein